MDDQNGIAGGLADTFHKFITGDTFIQGMKDMWAKHVSSPAPSDHDKAIADMNAQANAHKNDAANQSFIKPDVAASIRAKAKK